MHKTEKEIEEYVKTVKPRHKLNGIDEEDMWIIINNIQKYYQTLMETDRQKYIFALKQLSTTAQPSTIMPESHTRKPTDVEHSSFTHKRKTSPTPRNKRHGNLN